MFVDIITVLLGLYICVFWGITLFRKIKGFKNNLYLLIASFCFTIVEAFLFGYFIGVHA